MTKGKWKTEENTCNSVRCSYIKRRKVRIQVCICFCMYKEKGKNPLKITLVIYGRGGVLGRRRIRMGDKLFTV